MSRRRHRQARTGNSGSGKSGNGNLPGIGAGTPETSRTVGGRIGIGDSSAVFHLTQTREAGRSNDAVSVPGYYDLVWRPPEERAGSKDGDEERHQEMAGWLQKLAQWDWFCNLTFDRLVGASGARYWFNRYLESFAAATGVAPKAFRADEYGARNGRLHLHALIAGVSLGPLFGAGSLPAFCGERLPPGQKGKTCCGTHAWPCGYARVFPFDPEKGAAFYVSKYITKDNGEWELVGF